MEMLLVETVDGLGIVGDVVKVRSGFVRNYLQPRGLVVQPSPEAIASLAEKRKEAERKVAEQRAARAAMVEKLEGFELTLERSCNDLGVLYGSVTQQDISEALNAAGFAVRPRDVRISQVIKRIDTYEIAIKPESDLEASIKLWVVSDRKLEEVEQPEEPAQAEQAAAPAPEAAQVPDDEPRREKKPRKPRAKAE